MDIELITQILNNSEKFSPLFKLGIQQFEDYVKELDEPLKKLSNWIVENRVRCIDKYIKLGLRREEAITMALADISTIRELGKDFNKNLGRGK